MTRSSTHDDFIRRAREKHGDRYDYSRVIFTKMHDRIIVGCPEHGDFSPKAFQHLQYGCRACGNQRSAGKRRTSIEDFIRIAGERHNHKYDYRYVTFRTQHDLVSILCPLHGEFRQAANDHLKGHGCPACGVEVSAKSRSGTKLSTSDFLDRAFSKHGKRYEYKDTRFSGYGTKITITCSIHGDFDQMPGNHISGQGCPDCAKDASILPFGSFVDRAVSTHGGKYDYVSYISCDKSVGIVCDKHGLFYQRGADHLRGSGCPSCAIENTKERLRYTASEIQEMIRDKFGNRLDFDPDDYESMTQPMAFRCFVHGTKERQPLHVLANRHPCPDCGREAISAALCLSQEEFEEKARIVHKDKYRYGIYRSSSKPMEIVCPRHGSFIQIAGNHLHGYGCPLCGFTKRKSQTDWLTALGVPSEKHEVRLKIDEKHFIVDAYDEKTNTVYEFWGDFWHGNPKKFVPDALNTAVGITFGELWSKTQEKRTHIIKSGFNLIEIWESDWIAINEKKNR